jgi:hypothetical protein
MHKSISANSSLVKTDFMTARDQKQTTDVVFHAMKFLNSRNLIDHTMTKLATSTWKLMHEKEVMHAINKKRNSVSQDAKPQLLCEFFMDCCPVQSLLCTNIFADVLGLESASTKDNFINVHSISSTLL